MNIEIAIPTYDRAEIIKNKTLKLLNKFNVPKSLIRIFVKDQKELNKYIESIGEDYNYVLTGQSCVMSTRNFLRHYYQFESKVEGVFFMDDDIMDFQELGKPISKPFLELLQYFFRETKLRGFRYWSVNQSANSFFWSDRITTNLKYCLGGFSGLIMDRKKPVIYCDIGVFEDFQFSIEHFLADGGIVRFEKFGIVHKCFELQGGICGQKGGKAQRLEEHIENAGYLKSLYPDMLKVVEKKYGTDIKLNTRYKLE